MLLGPGVGSGRSSPLCDKLRHAERWCIVGPASLPSGGAAALCRTPPPVLQLPAQSFGPTLHQSLTPSVDRPLGGRSPQ